MCDRDFSNTSIEILKKFFTNTTMQEAVIAESKENFVKTLKLLYQPDVETECKENAKEFLQFLHSCEETTDLLRNFVYEVIKFFADRNKKAF